MAKQPKAEETIINVEKAYSSVDTFFNDNKKGIYIALGVVALLVAGFFGFRYFNNERNTEAAEMMWKAEYYFEVDSLDKAIKGDGTFVGFEYLADEYSGTKTGELAKYYLGVSLLKKGDYKAAIANLEEVSFDDEIVGAIAKGSVGDAYIELGQVEEGIKHFNEAVSHSENDFTSPIYLMKSGLAYEKLGEYNKALESYTVIKDKYPNSVEGREIEKYIAKAESFKK